MLMMLDNDIYFIVAAILHKEDLESGDLDKVIARFLDGKLSGKYHTLSPIESPEAYAVAYRKLAMFVREELGGRIGLANAGRGIVEVKTENNLPQMRLVRLVRLSEAQLKELSNVAKEQRFEGTQADDQEGKTIH